MALTDAQSKAVLQAIISASPGGSTKGNTIVTLPDQSVLGGQSMNIPRVTGGARCRQMQRALVRRNVPTGTSATARGWIVEAPGGGDS